MIGPWLDLMPPRFREFLDPEWTTVRATVALAARHEQAALVSLEAYVVADRDLTIETLALAGHRISVLLETVWPKGIPEDLAAACPCQSELDEISPNHFPECPWLDPNYDPAPFDEFLGDEREVEFDCDPIEEVAS